MKIRAFAFVWTFLIAFYLLNPVPHVRAESAALREGIRQYNQENYEEAIEALIKAREVEPASSPAAFFLGLAYKQAQDYPKALENLRDAVTLTPKIKEALVELIDVLYQLGGPENLKEAEKWIGVGEREGIYPAKTAFLKGLVLQKEGRYDEAIEAFKKAETLDESIAQSAEFQIGICFIKARKLKMARKSLETALLRDPQSDLASYARQYKDLVENRLFLERPLRFTLGLFGGYDDNLVLKPSDSSLAPGVTNEEAYFLNNSLRVNYVPKLNNPWLFNAQYAGSWKVHSNNTHTHDFVANSVAITPGYNFGRWSLNLVGGYNHFLVRNPSYKKYLEAFNAGPLLRFLVRKNHLLEVYGGFHWNYYNRKPLIPEENRDSAGADTYINWIWVFKKGAFLNMRYAFIDDNTEGDNWQHRGHKLSASATIPLIRKFNLQVTASIFRQNFKNTHTIFLKRRKDNTYEGSIGLTYEIFKNANIVAQYSRIRDDSNIGIYDYKKNIYTLGIEYRF